MAEAAPKKLTGLQMPLDISPELAKIIGTKKGEQVSRPQVVKKLWAYLKEKNLQVCSNIYKYCLCVCNNRVFRMRRTSSGSSRTS